MITLQPELNLSVSYDQIFRRPILNASQLGFVNFHAGKLPYYRGRNVLTWAIINRETEIGMTGHYIDEGVDTGDIILQRTFPIHWEDTLSDVMNGVATEFPDLVSDTVQLINNGQVQRQPQVDLVGTYFARREDGDEWIDWSDSSLNLYNKIRAISHPGPGARTLQGMQVVIVQKAFFDPDWPIYRGIPGQVVGRRPNAGVIVKTGDSTLLIQKVQTTNGEIQTANWRIGTRLGINLFAYLHTLEARLRNLEQILTEIKEAGQIE